MKRLRSGGRGQVLWLCAIVLLGSSLAQAGAVSSLICSNPGSAVNPDSSTSVNANSCTDFSYSMTQGANNWQYGYYNVMNGLPGTFQDLTPLVGQGFWVNDFTKYWTSIDAFGAHPNSYNTDLHGSPYCIAGVNCGSGPDLNASSYHIEQWAVREFVVPTNFQGGDVNITIQGQKDPRAQSADTNATAIDVYLVRGNTNTLETTLLVPAGMDPSAVSITLPNFLLMPGDKLDFALAPTPNPIIGHGIKADNNDPGLHTTDWGDGTFELITIQTSVPEPGTLFLLGGGLVAVGWRFRKRRG